MLDTKHFTQRTGGRTFEAAAFLRRAGADTAAVQRLFQSDLQDMVTRYDIIRRANLYREDIALAVIPEDGVDRVAAAQAADELLTLKGVKPPSWSTGTERTCRCPPAPWGTSTSR